MLSLKVIRFSTLLFLFYLIPATGWAQQYSFINYSIEEGLAQSQVEVIFQDQKGYLWFGTIGGISRFDGKNFTNYSTEEGLISNQVNSMMQDSKGNIWIGSQKGITRFNGIAFTSFDLYKELSYNNVNDLMEDREGNLWVATNGQGISKVDPQKLMAFDKATAPGKEVASLEEIFRNYHVKDGLPHPIVRSIVTDKDGKLWVGTRKGVCVYRGDRFEPILEEHLANKNISQIKVDHTGNLWFCTLGNGVFKYDGHVVVNYLSKDGLISDWIRSMEEDNQGNTWFVSKNGISKYDGSGFKNFTEKEGLSPNNIRCIKEDREGNLWLGTYGKGVLKFTGESFVIYNTFEGLSNDIVMSVVEDKDQNLWFSTYGSGLTKYVMDPEQGKYVVHYTTRDGLSNTTVWSSIMDKDQNLWFGTSSGVTMYDGQRFTRYNTSDGLIDKKVTALLEDSKGNLWFGTGKGVSQLLPEASQKPGNLFQNYSSQDSTIGKNVRYILEGRSGDLWFGTTSGAYQFNGGEFINYNKSNGLPDNTIYNILEDKRGNLWFGTKRGLALYDGTTFTPVKIGDNYKSNYINFTQLGDQERLWVGTNNGIYNLDMAYYYETGESKYTHYSKLDGIKSRECNLNAAYEDTKGYLWFGTSEGVVRYDPANLSANNKSMPPIVHINKVRLFLEETDWRKFTDSVDLTTGLPGSLKVKHHNNHFTFNFIGLHHSNPAKVSYRFMLEGFDSDWSPEVGENFATYSNLPDGYYTFVVKARNKDGVWSNTPARFNFEIAPPFWETWWFYTLCSLFGLAIGGIIYRWRSLVRKRKEETKTLIQRSKLLTLEQQTLNASMNRHFVFNALNSIQYYINKQDKRAANLYLTSFARLIRKNLDDSQNNLILLSEELERLELYLKLEHMRFTDKFKYKINVDRSIDVENVKIPSMLLQPFIENSIWHGILPMNYPGEVTVDISKDEEKSLVFAIEDNGIGIETSIKNKGEQKHISKGMRITKGRIDLLRKITKQNIFINGPFEIKDEKNEPKGTKVEIILPYNLN